MSKPEKHHGKWRVRWVDADGQRRSKSFTTFTEAERALRKLQSETDAIRAGLRDPVVEAAALKNFDELAEYWGDHVAAHKRRPKEDAGLVRRYLQPELGGKTLAAIDQKAVDHLRTKLYERELATNTRAHALSLLRAMLNKAVEIRWLSHAPRVVVPRPEVEDYNWIDSVEKVQAFVRAANELEHEAPASWMKSEGKFYERGSGMTDGLTAMYATSVFTGMRAGEVAGLEWDMVDLDRRLITVRRSFDKPTKTNEIRRVPILDPLLPILKEWKQHSSSPNGWVFPTTTGTMRDSRSRAFKDLYRAVLKRAKIEPHHPDRRLTYHDLRHTFASLWVQNGGDLFKLQKILGHKDVNMTLRYSHLAPGAFQDDYARLGGQFKMRGRAVVKKVPENG